MKDKFLYKTFEDIVSSYPDHTALVEANGDTTYASLNSFANQLSGLLLDTGLSSDDSVGVLLPGGKELIGSLLSCLKTGITYVPLSNSFSHARLQQAVSETAMKVLITDDVSWSVFQNQDIDHEFVSVLVFKASGSSLLGNLGLGNLDLISLEQTSLEVYKRSTEGKYILSDYNLARYSDANIEVEYPVDNSSYIFYSSGTTGKSKAIVGNQESIAHYINWHKNTFGFDTETRVSQIASVTFDASLKDILTSLISGSCLCIPAAKTRENMVLLGKWLSAEKVTILQTVPSLFRLLTNSLVEQDLALKEIKEVVLAGEKLYGRDVALWRSLSGHTARMSNLYGLTETTVLKSCYHIPDRDLDAGTVLPVGKAISNTLIAVINKDEICNDEEIGEVYIKSRFVSKGYLDQELTAALFVQNPLVLDREDLVCRTGDLGRYDGDGNLEILGRIDDQIKLHGVRVELDGIRSSLLNLEGIGQVELLLHTDATADSLLCYYSGTEYGSGELRLLLSKILDRSSIPDYFIYIAEFPLTLNGKVDKRALPKPSELLRGINYEVPNGAIEISLSTIWSELLSVPQNSIGRNDLFFDLGGSSLKAIQLISRVYKQHEVQLSIGEIFNHSALKAQALLIAASKGEKVYSAIKKTAEQEDYALSHAQRRLWVLDQLQEDFTAYSRPISYDIHGELNLDALTKSFRKLIERHESLRTIFILKDGEPRQLIQPLESIHFEIPVTDVSNSENKEGAIEEVLAKLAVLPFDLSKGPLFRTRVVNLGNDQHRLLFSIHHIISDAWSMQVLVRDLISYYNSIVKAEEKSLNALPIQYKDYAAWQLEELSKGALADSRKYWLAQLGGELPVLDLPSDYVRPSVQTYNGAQVYVNFSEQLSHAFRHYIKEQDSTPFMGFVSLVKVLLYRYSGQEDLIVGTPVAGREHSDLENQIGFYINNLALRTRFQGTESFTSLLQLVKETCLKGYENQSYPFDLLVDELQLSRDLSRFPLYDVAVVLESDEVLLENAIAMEGVDVSNVRVAVDTSLYDLTFWFGEGISGQISLYIEYNTDIYSAERIKRLGVHLGKLMESIVTDSTISLNQLPLIEAAEQKILLEQYQGEIVSRFSASTVVSLFEKQADRRKEALALKYEDVTLSYRELEERSNALAHYLQTQHAIGNGSVVGVMQDRSEYLLISILGVLKAGGAYLPIDPGYPSDRVAYMLGDGNVSLLLADAAITEYEVASVNIGDLKQELENHPKTRLNVALSGEDLAYVIYTSGSTGRPKGVMIRHNAIINLLKSVVDILDVSNNDQLLAITTFTFDISVLEFFTTLSVGGSVIIAPGAVITDPRLLSEMIDESGVTIVQATPSVWNLLLETGWQATSLLKKISGGEFLPLSLGTRLLAMPGELYNMFGPTETTIWSTSQYIQNERDLNSIGKPIYNTTLYILDELGQLVPHGVTGKLFIGGAGVAKGYTDPELTTKKFIKNPFNGDEVIYDTGDLCQWDFKGRLIYLGRGDGQVKLRGYRIELGEIESLLEADSKVNQAVVIVKGNDLLAYVTGKENVDVNTLKTLLRSKLPAYMVPAHIQQLEDFPLTHNGKISRKKLAERGIELTERTLTAPQTSTEEVLTELWQSILGVTEISTTDDFFEVGGHSLKAIQLILNIHKKLNVQIRLKDVFEYPKLIDLAAYTDQLNVSQYKTINPVKVSATYELSHAQRRLWILEQFESLGSTAYNIPMSYWLNGSLNIGYVTEAFRRLIERHEILRTNFKEIDGIPYQFISDADKIDFSVDYQDLSSHESPIAAAIALSEKAAFTSFNLTSDALLRVQISKVEDERYLFMLSMHHIITDEWSIKNLITEFLTIYNALKQKTAISLQPLSIQYKDYAAWQLQELSGEALQTHRNYWLHKLEGDIPVIDLPTDAPRPAVKTFNSTQLKYSFEPQLVAKFRSLLAGEKATLFAGLMAVTKILVHKYTGEKDIILGTPAAGRDHSDLEDQIGFYINALPLRTQLHAEETFADFLKKVKNVVVEAFDHQIYPFDLLIEDLGLNRDLSRSPLFDIVVLIQNNENSNKLPEMEGVTIEDHLLINEKSKVDLKLFFVENENEINLNLEYNTDLFGEERMQRLCRHFEELIRAVVEVPSQKIKELNYITAQERQQLLYDFNQESFDYDEKLTLVQLFEKQVDKTPHAIALETSTKSWTYEELNGAVNTFAKSLQEISNVTKGLHVGLMTDRNEWLIIGMLSILKAGAVYIPIDFSSPAERIQYILSDANISLLITESSIINGFSGFTANALRIDDIFEGIEKHEQNLIPNYSADDLAYVIYTSGSTGHPKGVLVSHKNCVNMVKNEHHIFNPSTEDRVLQFASPSFDASIAEIFMAITSGAGLVLATNKTLKDLTALTRYLKEKKVSVVILPPAYLAAIPVTELSFLRLIITAGDVANKQLAIDYSRELTYMNCYGPTECAVWATIHQVEASDLDYQRLPIGKPIGNLQIYILNESLQPQPIGVPGEMYIGGVGVTQGYLGKKELTEKSFLENPFGTGKIYKTGDLASWYSDGNIDFLGRVDTQVKIRGYRIELGEIESVLNNHSQIANSAVITKGEGNDKLLIAYYEGENALPLTAIQDHLKNFLPDYMLPSYIVYLEQLPKNNSGKIDKKALPDYLETAVKEIVVPKDPIEAGLLEVWQNVLGVQEIAMQHNFFSIGGHSLRAIQLMAQLFKKLEIKLELEDIFINPVFGDQVNVLKASAKTSYQKIEKVTGQPLYKLSYAQLRLWLLEQFEDETEAVNSIPVSYWLQGDLNTEALNNAFQFVIERHESLRTSFITEQGEAYQKILTAEEYSFEVTQEDATTVSNPKEYAQNKALELSLIPFNLEKAPLVKAHIIKVAADEYLFFLCVHHIIFDERSVHVFVKEIIEAYQAFLNHTTPVWPALPIQYKDYAAWQEKELHTERLSVHRAYWLSQFEEEIEVLDLPTDFPRPPVQTFHGDQVHLSLSPEISTAFRACLEAQETTLYMGLVTLVKLLLHRYTGQNDIIIGSPSAGREHPDLRDQIGFFINTLVLRTKFNEEETFNSLAKKVKNNVLNAFKHQVYPFDLLVNELQVERDMSRSPLFDVVVVLENLIDKNEIPEFEGLSVTDNQLDVPISKVDLRFYFIENESNISLTLEYNTDIYSKHRMENLLGHVSALMHSVIEGPATAVSKLNYLSAREQNWLLKELNQKVVTYDKNQTLVDIFEQQAAATPDNIALEFENKTFTYQQLNEQANQLAHHLREEYQVTKGETIALMVERNEWLIIGFLGILKSGGVYLPIDSGNSTERNNFMLSDANAKVLITESVNIFNVGDFKGSLFAIDIEFDLLETAIENPVKVNDALDLSYIYYTSGSTGQPKGVMLQHRNGVHMVYNQREQFNVTTNDCIIQFSSLIFDGSVFEFFLALANGARLLIAKNNIIKDAVELVKYMAAKEVTIAILPAAYFSLVAVDDLKFLRKLLSVGDAINKDQAIKCSAVTDTYNGYGPTECAVCTSLYKIKPEDSQRVRLPIGEGIANVQVHILDQVLNLVGEGIHGEICISSEVAIAKGYLNREELSNEKFIKNPFGAGMMYRTGDKGVRLADGTIDFLGRIDNQVKIRGYRIELNEIEKVIQSHALIIETLVTTYSTDGDIALVAYYTATAEISPTLVKDFMKTFLPNYMIPPYLIQLSDFPLNASGKIDKRKLPEPEIKLNTTYAAPRNAIEESLAIIWGEVLNKENIGIEDNFFESGGHSLRAIQLITKIYKEHQVQLNIGDIFSKPTLIEQAFLISNSDTTNYISIPKVEEEDNYPLSATQLRTWLQVEQSKNSITHNVLTSYMLTGHFHKEAFEFAFQQVIARHESLRTVFELVNGSPRQRIIDASDFTIAINYTDISKNSEAVKQAQKAELSSKVFHLDTAPLFNIDILRHEENKHELLFAMHHIISDEWSMQVMVKDLVLFYNAAVNGITSNLEPLPIQYKDYTAWQLAELSGDKLVGHKEYWLEQFKGDIPVLELASDRQRPEIMNHEGAQYSFRLEETVSQKLKELAKNQGATLFMGVTSLVKALFYKYTGNQDIIIGTPVAGRQHPDLEDQIGLYLNTLALRSRFSGEEGFNTLLSEVKKVSLDGFTHQVYPLDMLIEDLDVYPPKNRGALFDVVVILQNVQLDLLEGVEMQGLEVSAQGEDLKISKGDLRFQFMDQGTFLEGSIEYSTELYDEARISRMVTHMKNLLTIIVETPEQPLKEIQYLENTESENLDWFEKIIQKEQPQYVHKAFEAIVTAYPEKEAVALEEKSFTYQQINGFTNQIARLLLDLKVQPENAVGVLLPSGKELTATLMACFKTGATYVPMAAEFSKNRTEQVFSDTKMTTLIAAEKAYNTLNNTTDLSHTRLEKIILFSEEGILTVQERNASGEFVASDYSLANYSEENVAVEYSINNSSYIFYSSGTTGKSKAIVGDQESIAHYINWHKNTFGFDTESRVSQIASVTFDASLKDILTSLISGSCLCIPAPKTRENMVLLSQWLSAEKVTILQTVPSLFRLLTNSLVEQNIALEEIKEVVLAGEKLYGRDVALWRSLSGHTGRMSNLYGLTETTVLKSCYHIPSGDLDPGTVLPVGQAINNSMIAVINDNGLSMWGEIGEVYIRSPYISKGYLDQELTAALLVQNPLVSDREDLVCRTGDLGRYDSDGNLEILGRIDDQIKLHGIRVELDGIRSSLLNLEGVSQVELLLHNDATADSLLCYYTGTEYGSGELRLLLSAELDRSSIPDYFIYVAEFPLTLNGKVDKRALPKPSELLRGSNYEMPSGSIETSLSNIWAELLSIPQSSIGRNDSFFDLGGSSLKAIQLISRVYKNHEVQLSIGEIFNHSALKAQASLIAASKGDTVYSSIKQAAEQDDYALSHAQRRLWVQETQQQNGESTFNIFMRYQMEGKLQIEILQEAFDQIINRHESLRTIFVLKNGEPRQKIQSMQEQSFELEFEDLQGIKEQQVIIDKEVQNLAYHPFDLQNGPLMKVKLLKLDAENHMLLFVKHHIISDEWSLQIFVKEVLSIYNALSENKEHNLTPLTVQYKDYVAWKENELSNNGLVNHREFWLKKLQGDIPVLYLPTDFPRPPIQTFNGSELHFEFAEDTAAPFKQLLQEQNATLFMGLLCVVKTILYHYSGQEDIIVGTPIAGREHPDLEGQIGYYLNTLALRSTFDPALKFVDFLSEVKNTAIAAFEHQEYPFDTLIEDLNLKKDLSRSPLFDVVMILQNVDLHRESDLEMNGITINPIKEPMNISKSDLRFQFADLGNTIVGTIEYNTSLFKKERIEQLIAHMNSLVALVVTDSQRSLIEFDFLTDTERQQEQLASDFFGSDISTDF
ncbi:amino acid adenylation domain-containing protein [Flavobacterium circumlabens]|uniref:Amino acid adenylation domain-containing protein n=1 Tax=Flavobacterium circumlabens TaxID=2133765 RepID=A0A4Y7U9K1_9FLAO|nr:non-ribosomal peptide synthase/polyketide synthase [Flavobacterium circumlabens]TCN54731.1 tyrocidine synthetase-3 [Flavobacterium circumlabens]TEB42921.1 amino acid adenylation domain-containing protein [Flavobacterium circumlabens]